MHLYETEWRTLTGDLRDYHTHWRAGSHIDAARRAFAHAAEIGCALSRVKVSTMVEPEGDGGGLVYVANDTRRYELWNGKVRRDKGA